MQTNFWDRQLDEPLFPNLLWSRPENKLGAGKLLIIGGQAQEFSNVAEVFTLAEKSGAGTIRVILPDSTRKYTSMLPNIEYAPSNISGSFARPALAELLHAANWADSVIIAGDLGKNSETSLLIEDFIQKYPRLIIISHHAIQSLSQPSYLAKKKNIILITQLNEFQKLASSMGVKQAITSDMGNKQLAEVLKDFSIAHNFSVNLVVNSSVWSCSGGRVTLTTKKSKVALNNLVAETAVWAMQNPGKTYEALVTAAYC